MILRLRSSAAIVALATGLTACTPTATVPTMQPASAGIGDPSGDVAVVRREAFQMTFKLQGVSAESDTISLLSNRQMMLVTSRVDGERVDEGAIVGDAVVDPTVAAALQARNAHSSIDQSRLQQLRTLEGPVTAPVGGILQLGGSAPELRTAGIDVVVSLTPIQQLRYESIPFTGRATIETTVGTRQVDCAAVWISTTGPDRTGDVVEAPAPLLHCRLPGFVETAAGLRGLVTLTSERFDSVIVIPNLYIGYDQTVDGYYVTVLENDQPVKIPVTVGVTDGVVRVITSDLPVGATLLLPGDDG